MSDPNERPFSSGWVMLSVVLFLAIELIIGTWLGPLIVGKYVSPMFHYQVQMLMHLGSLYLGGLAVGIVSPGRRLMEPAVGAFISVLLVFLMSFFMPTWFFVFDLTKVLVGGGIGFLLALFGAWTGEKWMGNLPPDEMKNTTRGRLRSSMWEDELNRIDIPQRDRER
ncbi:MAG: hypothetical protein JNM17_36045 [Archangium sp.]|nr:hypothetical protein [Archangium sp.]